MQQSVRLILHALLGGFIGVMASVIFLAIYYFQEFDTIAGPGIIYDIPGLRFKSALLGTILILIVVWGISYRKWIVQMIRDAYGIGDEDEAKQVETNK